MNPSIEHANEKLSQMLWTAFILMFFAMQAIIWTIAVSITSHDNSHSIVAGYERQAFRWDEVKSAQMSSDQLGWHSQLTISGDADIHCNRTLTLRISDENDRPIANAQVALKVFHRGTAAIVQDLTLEESETGRYQSSIHIHRAGKWCIQGTAIVNDDVYQIDQTIDAASSGNY